MGKLVGLSSSSSSCSEAATGLVNSTPNCSETFYNFSSKRMFFSLLLCNYTLDLWFLEKMKDQNFPVLSSAFLLPPNRNIQSWKAVSRNIIYFLDLNEGDLVTNMKAKVTWMVKYKGRSMSLRFCS